MKERSSIVTLEFTTTNLKLLSADLATLGYNPESMYLSRVYGSGPPEEDTVGLKLD